MDERTLPVPTGWIRALGWPNWADRGRLSRASVMLFRADAISGVYSDYLPPDGIEVPYVRLLFGNCEHAVVGSVTEIQALLVQALQGTA